MTGTDAPVVSVRGEAVREVPPEIASFTVEVAARDSDRQAVLRRLTERVEGLRAVLEEYTETIERRETTRLHVAPERKKGAYRGTATTSVTVADLTVVGELMLRLADQDQTSVYGPFWAVRPDSPVHRTTRRAAVDDAVVRAREYAEAVGARIVRLLEISDVGDGYGIPLSGRMMAFAASDSGGAPQLELDPQMQTITARVAMRFTLTEPEMSGGSAAGGVP